MSFARNMIDKKGKIVKDEGAESVNIRAGAIVKSIGYQTAPISGVAFDSERHVVTNEKGRVTLGGEVIPGMYVAGWAKRGPVGIIDATLRDAKETVQSIIKDVSVGAIKPKPEVDLSQFIPDDCVTYSDWLKVNTFELERGVSLHKIREKITSRDQMLEVAKQ